MEAILFLASCLLFLSLLCFIPCQGCCPQDASDRGATYNPTSGRCFLVVKVKVEWATAVNECLSIGASLGVPDVTSDAAFVNGLSYVQMWINVNDLEEEGTYVSSAGENVTRFLWASDEPSDPTQPWDQDCVILNPLGEWEDKPCHEKNDYVCEWNLIPEKNDSHIHFKKAAMNSLCNYVESTTRDVTGLLRCARHCASTESCLLFAYSSVMTSSNCVLYEYLLGSNSKVTSEWQLYDLD